MIAALLETPFIDVILIVLALRLFFPALFGVRKKNIPQSPKDRVTIQHEERNKKQNINQQAGKYIDYEEIK